MALLQKILGLPIPSLDATLLPPPVTAIMTHVLPQPPLSRTLLSRGLQHASGLVQFTTLCGVERILTKMANIEAALQAMIVQSKSPAIWQSTLEDIQLRLWLSLPDVQTIIGLVAKKSDDQRGDLLSEKAISVVGYYLCYQGKQMAGQKFNLIKLLPADLSTIHPRLQLGYLRLMKTSYGNKNTHQPNTLSVLLSGPLALSVSSPCAAVRSLAAEVVIRGLSESSLFEHHRLEACAYVNAFIQMNKLGQPLSVEAMEALKVIGKAINTCTASPYTVSDAVAQIVTRILDKHPLSSSSSSAMLIDGESDNEQHALVQTWTAYLESIATRLPTSPLLWALLEEWKMGRASHSGVATYIAYLLEVLADGFVPAVFLNELVYDIANNKTCQPTKILSKVIQRLKHTSWFPGCSNEATFTRRPSKHNE
ncbi:hypothetical protein BDF19DRAFT_322513 [Syncephalis fuscata]|nr:hypothetical protein BDF19DRAFT_322513 [Syncephalis fuscata]